MSPLVLALLLLEVSWMLVVVVMAGASYGLEAAP